MKDTKLINFFAGPSAGKSTRALNLAGWMKEQRMNVEYIGEFPKDLTWNERIPELDNQLYLLGEQNHRIYMQYGKVDYIVTDGPLLLGLHYAGADNQKKFQNHPNYADWLEKYKELVFWTHSMYNNVNFYVNRGDRKFIQEGRNQNESESRTIDMSVQCILDDWGIDYFYVNSQEDVLKELKLI
jgi:hypothetical protein